MSLPCSSLDTFCRLSFWSRMYFVFGCVEALLSSNRGETTEERQNSQQRRILSSLKGWNVPVYHLFSFKIRLFGESIWNSTGFHTEWRRHKIRYRFSGFSSENETWDQTVSWSFNIRTCMLACLLLRFRGQPNFRRRGMLFQRSRVIKWFSPGSLVSTKTSV